MVQVGIIGASGYTGAELLRLCAAHPDLEVALATGDTMAGTPAAELYPSLAAAYPDLTFSAYDPAAVAGADLVFLGLPHGASQAIVPELFRDEIKGAAHVATPGCYPTAASLALAPLVRARVVATSGIIVDAASGVSGAGRPPKPSTTFCTVDEDFTAYGLLDHRHTPEMEQVLGASVLFTPHLAPMNRGILATCYAQPTRATSTGALLDVLQDAYADEPFVVVLEGSPSTKATLGSNTAHVTARYDERTGTVLAIAALDNLTKGASGAAVQCANLLLGLPETTGLPTAGLYP